MRGVWAVALATVILPVAGKMAALSPSVHVVTFTPGADTLRVHRAPSSGLMAFEDFVAARHPSIAFNGTYYGMDDLPLGLLRSNGKWVFRNGRMRTVFAVSRRGVASVITRDDVRRSPGTYPFAIAAGPRLLRAGAIDVQPEKEGFRPAARRIRASRVALGVRRDGTGVVVVDEDAVTLDEFARVCREAGAVDAVNLDGGGATALYRAGRVVVSPRIPMANILTITRR